jgi:protein regulator of cytokinesis 1
MSEFIIRVREEITKFQNDLLLSEEEKAEFGAFIDDSYTEELLATHEEEAARLRAEIEASSVHLARVKEWLGLKADEEELERSAADPNRFKKRGTAMLQEERMRKRVEKRKPKVS